MKRFARVDPKVVELVGWRPPRYASFLTVSESGVWTPVDAVDDHSCDSRSHDRSRQRASFSGSPAKEAIGYSSVNARLADQEFNHALTFELARGDIVLLTYSTYSDSS